MWDLGLKRDDGGQWGLFCMHYAMSTPFRPATGFRLWFWPLEFAWAWRVPEGGLWTLHWGGGA